MENGPLREQASESRREDLNLRPPGPELSGSTVSVVSLRYDSFCSFPFSIAPKVHRELGWGLL